MSSVAISTKRTKPPLATAVRYRYCVFQGNYPQYIRNAMFDREGENVEWIEVEPTVDSINSCDMVWKPFNFLKNVSNEREICVCRGSI